jgi:hypothetical protein
LAAEEGPDQLVPEKLHEAGRVRSRNGVKRAILANKAIGDRTGQMRMEDEL